MRPPDNIRARQWSAECVQVARRACVHWSVNGFLE